MATTELEAQRSAVPALVNTPALDIGADDVALPKLKIGQFMSEPVQQQLVPAGSIFHTTGQDDPEPIVLWEPPKKAGAAAKAGPIFYVLALKKGKSISSDGELEMWDFHDPSAPPEAWTTYKYAVAIPDVAEDVPFNLLLTRTGAPSAKGINTVLARNVAKGPAYIHAFQMTTKPRENAKGKFFVPSISIVEADPKHVEIAGRLATMISGVSADVQASTPSEQPAI